MSDVTSRRSPRSGTLLTLLAAAAVSLVAWVAIGETPAAERVSEQVRPYDPLP